MRSLSVLLSAMETRTALEIAQLASEAITLCILALATIQRLQLFEGGDNLRVASNTVCNTYDFKV